VLMLIGIEMHHYPILGRAELLSELCYNRGPGFRMKKTIAISLLIAGGFFSAPRSTFAAAACDHLRSRECEGEDCLAKFKAIQDCELALIAEEQARSRRRMLQRQREAEAKRKKDLQNEN
jgi:hypothetical protein